MKTVNILIFILCLVVVSCSTDGVDFDVITIDLTRNIDASHLNLNEYVTDLNLIRLETTENSLIRRFNGYVGDKYILAIENDKVLQFSSDGKFIRTIAKRGKGPDEFNQIDAWTVDENEQYFLFHDVRKNAIHKYDLDNYLLRESIPFEDKGYLSDIVLVNDSIISILPGMFSEYGYLYFNQSTSGRIINGIKKEIVEHPGAWAGSSPVFKKTIDNFIVFQPSESDTIFLIDAQILRPIISIIPEKPKQSGYITTGSFVTYLYSDNQMILLFKIGYESTVTPTSSYTSIGDTEYLLFDIKSRKINKLDSFVLEIEDLVLNIPDFNFPDKNRIVLTYQALEFKEILNEALSDKNIPEAKREKLNQLNSQISENDNPILITGKWMSIP